MIKSRVTTRVATAIDASAEIVGFADGSPVRLRRNGCSVKPMGLDMSVKNGDHVPWESRHEQRAFWHAEMHPGVVRYGAQPHTLYLTIGGRRVSYTPDMLIEAADGSFAVIEVKDTFEEAKDPDYTAKLQQAALIYASLGWVLKVVTKEQLEAEPMFSDLELLHRYRKATVIPDTLLMVQDALAPAPIRLGALRQVLPSGPLGMAQLSALLVHRVIGFRLEQGLCDDIEVDLADRGVWGLPFIGSGI